MNLETQSFTSWLLGEVRLQKVPVCDKGDLNTCSSSDREELLQVCGVAAEEAEEGDDGDNFPTKRKYAKRFSGRALFRVPSCPDDVPMFPLDPSILLYQEVYNFLGPSWVLLGTPGGGNGVLAALKAGLPCLSIYRSKLHSNLARSFILRKLAELMCMPGSLANTHLVIRAQALHPPKVSKKTKKPSEASASSQATDASEQSSSPGEAEETAEIVSFLDGKQKEKKTKSVKKDKKTPKKSSGKKEKDTQTPKKKDTPKKKEKSEKDKSVSKKEKKQK